MAWLELAPSGIYQISFRFADRNTKSPQKTADEDAANARLHRVDESLRLVEGGRLVFPEHSDSAAFLLSVGQLIGEKKKPERHLRTRGQFNTAFLAAIPKGSFEDSTPRGMEMHFRHLERRS